MVVRPPAELTAPPGSLVKLIVRFPKVIPDGPLVFELFRIIVLFALKVVELPPKMVEPKAVVF